MNLRYHNADLGGGRVVTILSMPPQKRTILVDEEYSYERRTVWFPDTIFVLQYKHIPSGFLYGGLHSSPPVIRAGLHVFFSKRSFNSLDDEVFGSMTEHYNMGRSCTDHLLDHTVFKTSRLLVGTVLNSWWLSAHLVSEESWFDMSLDEVRQCKYCERCDLSWLIPDGARRKLIDKPLGKLPFVPVTGDRQCVTPLC